MTNAQASGAARPSRFLTLSSARELGILLCLSVMFPFMIHIIPVPQDSRLGARLLPMFYAPLLAALLGRTGTAYAIAMLAPWLNWAVTGYPEPAGAAIMTLQLVVFVGAMRAMIARAPACRWLSAPAFVACMAAAALAAALMPRLVGGRGALEWALSSVATGLPGLGVLVLINWLVLRYYPPGASGGGPRFA